MQAVVNGAVGVDAERGRDPPTTVVGGQERGDFGGDFGPSDGIAQEDHVVLGQTVNMGEQLRPDMGAPLPRRSSSGTCLLPLGCTSIWTSGEGVFSGPSQQEEAALLRQANPSASLASWAIRFAAGLDGVLTVLSGMSAPAQLEDNIGYMERFEPLSSDEIRLLEQVAGIIHAKAEIACTNCRYCTTECPKQIAIPDYFGLYNNMKRLKNTGYTANQRVCYANLAQTHGRTSDCVRCGLCERNCPQWLPIRSLPETVAKTLKVEDVKFPALSGESHS